MAEAAFWIAVGATICSLRKDFDDKNAHFSHFSLGQRLVLDRDKVVQYEGEDDRGLRLRVDNGKGILIVPSTHRMRLQPTNSRKPLAKISWAGKSQPDLLDQLLDIDCQGARHIFSTKIALVTSVTRALNLARRVEASADLDLDMEPVPTPDRLQVLHCIRRSISVLNKLSDSPNSKNIIANLLCRSEEIASLNKMSIAEQLELEVNLNLLLESCYRGSGPESVEDSIRQSIKKALDLVLTDGPRLVRQQFLIDLFQWGSLSADGIPEIRSTGQLQAQSALLLSSDFISLREYYWENAACPRNGDTSLGQAAPLIVASGTAALRAHTSVLNNILDEGVSVILCIERKDQEAAALLKRLNFETWSMAAEELRELSAPQSDVPEPLFGDLQRGLQKFAYHRLEEHACHHHLLSSAAENLIRFFSKFESEVSEKTFIKVNLYGLLLYLTRLLHEPSGDKTTEFNDRVTYIESELGNCATWLTRDQKQQVHSILNELRSIGTATPSSVKMTALRDIIRTSDDEKYIVVLSDERHIEPARTEWKWANRGNAFMSRKDVLFCSPSALPRNSLHSDKHHAIICGWLGATRMPSLIDGYLAPKTTVLLYPYELSWLRTSLLKWRRNENNIEVARRYSLTGSLITGSDIEGVQRYLDEGSRSFHFAQ